MNVGDLMLCYCNLNKGNFEVDFEEGSEQELVNVIETMKDTNSIGKLRKSFRGFMWNFRPEGKYTIAEDR